MAITYPTTLDGFTNPISSDTLDNPPHSEQHTDANDAIEALETKVGTGSSTPSANTIFCGSGTGSSSYKSAPNTIIRVRAYLAADKTNLVDAAWTKVLLDTETYDDGNDFDATNSKFVVPVAGFYLIIGKVTFENVVADKAYTAAIYQNSSVRADTIIIPSASGYAAAITIDIRELAADDTIELYARSDAGVNTVDIQGGARYTT